MTLDDLIAICDDPQADEASGLEWAIEEIERLCGALKAVTTFHQVTHCHAAARAALAGMPVGEKPKT